MSHNSSSNYRRNKAEIDKFRKELKSMFDDISNIDINVLNRAVQDGVKEAKERTNVISGFMRKKWRSTPTTRTIKVGASEGAVTKSIINTADYAPYVNYGHRIVNKSGETVGWVRGQYILERTVHKVDKVLLQEFRREVERVNRKHDK